MSKKKTEEVIEEIAIPLCEKLSFELVDVEFVKEGTHWYLRVYIDKEGGITIDDCQALSEELSKEIDKDDPITQKYFLEVSSPGLERPFKKEKDYIKYKDQTIEVKLFKPIDGKKVFEGELVGLIDQKLVIKQKDTMLEFDKENVAIARRVIKF